MTRQYVSKMKETWFLQRQSVASKNILYLLNTPFFFANNLERMEYYISNELYRPILMCFQSI